MRKFFRRLFNGLTLATSFRECRHYSTFIPGNCGTLVTCFYCGSTRRVGETDWATPWIWRISNS